MLGIRLDRGPGTSRLEMRPAFPAILFLALSFLSLASLASGSTASDPATERPAPVPAPEPPDANSGGANRGANRGARSATLAPRAPNRAIAAGAGGYEVGAGWTGSAERPGANG